MKSFLTKFVLLVALSFALTGCYKSSQERAAEHFENGMKLAEAGDLPRAIVEFRNTLKYDENNLDAYRQMARANLALNETASAYAGFLRVVEQAPQDVEGRIALSEMAFAWQNWEEFDRHSAKLAEIGSDLPTAKAVALAAAYRRAVLDQDRERRGALIRQAETLALDLPDHQILQRIRIDHYVGEGAHEAALVVVDDSIARNRDDIDLYVAKLNLLGAIDDQTRIEATLRAMLDRFPADKTTKQTFLRFLISRGRLQDAEDFLEENLARSAPEGRNGAFFDLISFLRETRDDDVALERIESALAGAQAQNQIVQTLRATLMFEMGRRDEGIAALRAVLATNPITLTKAEVLNAQTTLARMLLGNGDAPSARQMIQQVLAEDAEFAEALKIRAMWLIQDDETTPAINDLRLALDRNPDDAEAMVIMANAYQRAGKPDLRLDFLAQASDTSNSAPGYALLLARALMENDKLLQAENALKSSLRLAPGNVEILQTLGQIYLRLNDLPRTDHVARTLAKIETEQAQTTAQALFAEVVARRVGVDEALQYLEQQAHQDGDATVATLAIIQAQLKTGRVDDALRTASQAVEENPNDPRLRNALALSHVVARNFRAAEAEFMTLIDAYPEAIDLYLQLARINAAQGNFAAGAAIIENGLSVVPNAPDLLWAKASYLEQQGDIAGAIAIYDRLYAENSGSAIIANNLASLLVSYRDDAASLDRAEIIGRRLNGTDIPAFQDTYGYIQFRRGNLQEALRYLEPAAAGLPNDPAVQFHLAEVYAALDQPTEALRRMRMAQDLAGPFGDVDFKAKVTDQIAQIEGSQANE